MGPLGLSALALSPQKWGFTDRQDRPPDGATTAQSILGIPLSHIPVHNPLCIRTEGNIREESAEEDGQLEEPEASRGLPVVC